MEFVEVSGSAVWSTKVKRQWRLLQKKGPLAFLNWRWHRFLASDTRDEVARELELRLANRPFIRLDLPISRHFSGFNADLVAYLKERKPTYVLQCGAWLLPKSFIAQVPPVLNLHPGILPGIRGLDPVFWALYYCHEEWLGSTLHLIDAGIDTGKPLLRLRLKRRSGDSMVDLIERQIDLESELLGLFVKHHSEGLEAYDQGGAATSIYRSNWTRSQYHRLKAAQWWGGNASPHGALESLSCVASPSLLKPGR